MKLPFFFCKNGMENKHSLLDSFNCNKEALSSFFLLFHLLCTMKIAAILLVKKSCVPALS